MEKQGKGGCGKLRRVGPLLWQVICSRVLTNPAEQGVVEQVIGEALIDDNELLHREALALLDILTTLTAAISGRRHHPPNHRNDDNLLITNDQQPRRLQPRRSVSEKTAIINKASASRVNHSINPDKTIGNPDKTVSNNQEKTIINHSRASGSSRVHHSNPEKTIINRASVLRANQSNHLDDGKDCFDDDDDGSLPGGFDFAAIVRERASKINAYDIDEVVDELRQALAAEHTYLNQCVEQLRQALDKCTDSYSMVKNKSGLIDSIEIKDHRALNNDRAKNKVEKPITPPTSLHKNTTIKNSNLAQTDVKLSLPLVIKKSVNLEEKGHIAQRSTSSQLSQIIKPSSPILKNTNKTNKPSSKHVMATRNITKSSPPIQERRKTMS